MPLVIQVVVTGVAAGAVYGLVATGYALVYRLTGVVHLAFGELLGLAGFAMLLAAAGSDPLVAGGISPGRYAIGLGAGLAVAVLSSLVLYAIVRPFLRPGRELGWIGAVAAVAFAVRGVLASSFARESYVFPDLLPLHRLGDAGVLRLGGGVTLPIRTFFVIAVGFALAAAMARLLDRSRVGVAFRAIAEDPMAARAVGLPVDALRFAAFALAGGVAILAVIVSAPSAPFGAATGGAIGLKGLVAALLAGFGSPWRALGAGAAVGIVETAVSVSPLPLIPGELRDVVPLLLALVLLAGRRRTASLEVS
ncbi:MAG TPA: hypothetical protein VM638_04555 [Actinomycetota bacterium]|nr:hypothetical protein [Actinomycetota bacterium]